MDYVQSQRRRFLVMQEMAEAMDGFDMFVSGSGEVGLTNQTGHPAVLVSVDSIVGSTPREAGARMIVTDVEIYGTIGGGNLEFQACRIARDQLELGAEDGLHQSGQKDAPG